jgi:tRNA dimethylallyltransferase
MIIVIVGPTAVGKSALAVELAKRLDAEIISGDSVQIYKRLTIGSAKPTTEEQDGVVHHLIDEFDLGEPYSVADFQREVRKRIDRIQATGKPVILCGGTGFYVKAALYDYVFDHASRDHAYEASLQTMTNDELYDTLTKLDPTSAAKFHPNNRIRVLRALGYYHANQAVISSQTNKDVALYDYVGIGLTMDRALLYAKIDKRVDEMMRQGLLQEVESLRDHQQDIQAIGYNELFDALQGEGSIEEAVSLIKQHSRQLAKRQMTWFRNQMPLHWLDTTHASADEILNQALKVIESKKQSTI